MTDLREQITAAGADLDRMIANTTRRLEDQIGDLIVEGRTITPLDMLDSHGQPILAPLLIARAQLLAALGMLEAANR